MSALCSELGLGQCGSLLQSSLVGCQLSTVGEDLLKGVCVWLWCVIGFLLVVVHLAVLVWRVVLVYVQLSTVQVTFCRLSDQ